MDLTNPVGLCAWDIFKIGSVISQLINVYKAATHEVQVVIDDSLGIETTLLASAGELPPLLTLGGSAGAENYRFLTP